MEHHLGPSAALPPAAVPMWRARNSLWCSISHFDAELLPVLAIVRTQCGQIVSSFTAFAGLQLLRD